MAANEELDGRNAALEERCKTLDRKYAALERSCDKLEARCSSLERSIQVLKKDVDWKYSAPDISRSHWIKQGHDGEYADKLEKILRHVKFFVQEMRKGNRWQYCLALDNEEHQMMQHDDAMLPHFIELADVIQLSGGINDISLSNIELHPTVLEVLFPSMENKVIEIDMRHVTFPDVNGIECFKAIASSIRRNNALKDLTWINNRISSDEQADVLIESIADNRTIERVQISNCFNQDQEGVNSCRALVSLMMSEWPFEEIEFNSNGLSDIDDVAAALVTNQQIKLLSMSGNELNDRDAELIAQALKQNTNLHNLFLLGNNITSAGFEKLLEAIYDPSSLNAMGSCNHTCYVDCLEEDDDYEGGNDDNMTPQQRRRRKFYKLLSTRHAEGSNARHLNAELGERLSVKLIPRVIERIQQYSGDRSANSPSPISLIFELMESWKMTELYGHRRSYSMKLI